MDKISVSKTDLLAKLRLNRTAHEQAYKDAIEKYKKAIVFYLKKTLTRAEQGKKVNHHISVVEPTNNLKDYDRIIGMLEMDTHNVIDLNTNEYSQYVLDDWNWKDSFSNSSGLYNSGKYGFPGFTGYAGITGSFDMTGGDETNRVFQADDLNLQD